MPSPAQESITAALFLSGLAAIFTFFHLKRNEKTTQSKKVPTYSVVSLPYMATESGEVENKVSRDVIHYPLQHLADKFSGRETFPSPLLVRVWPKNLNFVSRTHEVLESQLVSPGGSPQEVRAFVRSGPHERLFFDPKLVKAAVVTCGGLCPGLNTVIREIVMCLTKVYGCSEVYGVVNGYCGFYNGIPWKRLTPTSVEEIHEHGGTVLGSSRGGFDLDKILDSIVEKGINQLFILGGDGTHRGAQALVNGANSRGLCLSVIGVPKTIDNDIGL